MLATRVPARVRESVTTPDTRQHRIRGTAVGLPRVPSAPELNSGTTSAPPKGVSSGEHRRAEADAYVLYYYAPAASNQSWYFVSQRVPRTPVRFDAAESDIAERTLYFLDMLEYLARG